eukprot:m.94408 g.94408  ORF g.94408 m.94408 type:complete len:1042 (-) comp15123_c1_seq1:58-3183(-)
MPLRLDIKRQLSARSDRVKCVDMHPTEPWMLVSLYNGLANIWNYETQSMVKQFEVSEQPVRCGRFVHRKNWIVVGSDDMQVRVFNYNTLEKVFTFEAHADYIRAIAVHPTQPYLLTSSDDMCIKLWDWEKKWQCTQVFEGHTHYVMAVMFNPKDSNTFASCSLDRTVKVWQLGAIQPNFTLSGHEKGINCLDYFQGGEKPYLVTGGDDRLVKIWDYQNKTCVQTLEGHTQNVCSVIFHPELPVILTGSEDGTVRVWHANTYRLENTLNYGLERVWTMAYRRGSNNVGIGYDEGAIIIKLGREEPAMSMDVSGKVVMAKHNEVQQTNLAALKLDEDTQDGEALPVQIKDLGSCEVYPQSLAHNPNGRFVVVCGDGEFIIHTAISFRNKSFGQALEFVWGADSSMYAVRENSSKVKVFKNFKEIKQLKPDFSAEGIYGGILLGIRGASSLSFYDWDSTTLIRRIDIEAKQVIWSETGEYVAIASTEECYVLKYDPDAEPDEEDEEDEGIEAAFELLQEIPDVVRAGRWIGDCFLYTNASNRLNYFVGGEIVTVAHLDRPMYLLGYLAAPHSRVYLADKDLNIVSYRLAESVLQYQTAVMRGDFETADTVMPKIPKDQRTRVAQFLEKQGFKEQALVVSTDNEHRFDLAVALNKLQAAADIAAKLDSQHKWKQLGEVAMKQCNFGLAETCLEQAKDFPGLLLLFTSNGKRDKVADLATAASEAGQNNIAFTCLLLQGKVDECVDLLCNTNRLPEAALFARTYVPSQVPRVLALWKEHLAKTSAKAAHKLADPEQYSNLFPERDFALQAEQFLRSQSSVRPSTSFRAAVLERETPLEERMAGSGGVPEPEPEPVPVVAHAEPVAAPEPEPEAEPEPAGPRVVLTDERIEVSESIHFGGNKADIDAKSFQLIEEIANVMQHNDHIDHIEIGGHCSDTGGTAEKDAWEMELSQLRAEAVRHHLIQLGVSPSRLTAKGYGDTKPIADNTTRDGRAANRRVEFVIVQKVEHEVGDDELDLGGDDDLDLGDDDLDIDPDTIDDEDLLDDM